MATSSNLNFPTSGYASKVQASKTIDEPTFFAVPGPQGPVGPIGLKGEKGSSGESIKGDPGEPGPAGKNGKDGKDGKSYFPVYKQNSGWAKYISDKVLELPIGSTRGVDGWVSFWINGDSKNENYLPEKSVSLYINDTKRINTKGLETGSQLQIVYDFQVTTFNNNTELWARSIFPGGKNLTTTFVASLKYQHTYDISVTHSLTIDSDLDKTKGIVPQLMSDLDAIASLKSIYISVF